MQAGQQRQNQFGMQNAFMPEGYMNDNYSMRQAGNPYFLPEPQDLYVTMAPDYWNQSNPMTWQDYTTQMQEDYGHYSPPKEAAPAAKPAKSKYDYSKYFSGDIWNTKVSNIGKTFTDYLGNVGREWSYGNFDNYSRYAPKKPGADATQEDWRNYREANNLWNQGLSNIGGGGEFTRSQGKMVDGKMDWSALYDGWNRNLPRINHPGDGGG